MNTDKLVINLQVFARFRLQLKFAFVIRPIGSVTLVRSGAERSKDHNKATAVTTKLQVQCKKRCTKR